MHYNQHCTTSLSRWAWTVCVRVCRRTLQCLQQKEGRGWERALTTAECPADIARSIDRAKWAPAMHTRHPLDQTHPDQPCTGISIFNKRANVRQPTLSIKHTLVCRRALCTRLSNDRLLVSLVSLYCSESEYECTALQTNHLGDELLRYLQGRWGLLLLVASGSRLSALSQQALCSGQGHNPKLVLERNFHNRHLGLAARSKRLF